MPADPPHDTAPVRIASVDLMRGLVMIVMALDHVRDFFSPFPYQPTDLSQASPALFLTRWITHFCAPTFIFLAGTSAWFYWRNSGATRASVQRFLLTRGLWLIVLELTVLNLFWNFALDSFYVQVIWAIGCSMIVLALLLYLPYGAIVAFGLVLVFGHDLLDGIKPEAFGDYALLWGFLHARYFTEWHGIGIGVLYPLIPWAGVMALGFAFGRVLEREPARRKRFLLIVGAVAIELFLVLRLTNIYGDPNAWTTNPRGFLFSALEVLNVSKYPPSLDYLLMTLGPVLMLLPLLERWRGKLADAISVFGRVPLFFYLLHVPVIHIASWTAARIVFGGAVKIGADRLPAGYEPSLLRAYAVWILVIVALYFPCRWYADYKRRHRDNRWLSYL